jgi:hypothetical protein
MTILDPGGARPGHAGRNARPGTLTLPSRSGTLTAARLKHDLTPPNDGALPARSSAMSLLIATPCWSGLS